MTTFRDAVRRVTGSLRAQLMLATAIPVGALLLVLTLVGLFGFSRMTHSLVEQRDAELVQLAAQQVANYWGDAILLLTQTASTGEVRRGDVDATRDLLQANMALQKYFDEISVTNARGLVTASVGGHEGDQFGNLAFFERARQQRRPVRSQTFEDANGRKLIAVAVPVYDPFGRFGGCMMGIWELRGSQLGLPLRNVRVGERGFAYLVDEYGVILYHPDQGYIGTNVSDHPAVSAFLQGHTGAQTVNTRDQETVVGYAPIPMRQLSTSLSADESWEGWGLLTSELWDDIVSPLQPYVQLMVLLLVLVVTAPLIILAVSSRQIAAPLQSLVTQVERVAEGEFDSEVSINAGPTEVQNLEVAFNKMVTQLRKYRADIQRYVVSILTSQEQERKRIARELHDETAQALIVLGRRIEMAEELDEVADDDDLYGELERLRDLVDATLQGVRRFVRDLRPPLLEELGLPRSLEILGNRVEREEPFAVEVRIQGAPRQYLAELELGIYRLAQEGLSNIRRHARATRATVTLTYGDNAIILEVMDDGVGFDAPTDPGSLMSSGRLGLMGIHERARLFGGKATIVSEPGTGTSVRVVIPISPIVLPQGDDDQDGNGQSADLDAVQAGSRSPHSTASDSNPPI